MALHGILVTRTRTNMAQQGPQNVNKKNVPCYGPPEMTHVGPLQLYFYMDHLLRNHNMAQRPCCGRPPLLRWGVSETGLASERE